MNMIQYVMTSTVNDMVERAMARAHRKWALERVTLHRVKSEPFIFLLTHMPTIDL